jgi:hypothetical protein
VKYQNAYTTRIATSDIVAAGMKAPGELITSEVRLPKVTIIKRIHVGVVHDQRVGVVRVCARRGELVEVAAETSGVGAKTICAGISG